MQRGRLQASAGVGVGVSSVAGGGGDDSGVGSSDLEEGGDGLTASLLPSASGEGGRRGVSRMSVAAVSSYRSGSTGSIVVEELTEEQEAELSSAAAQEESVRPHKHSSCAVLARLPAAREMKLACVVGVTPCRVHGARLSCVCGSQTALSCWTEPCLLACGRRFGAPSRLYAASPQW